MTPKQIVITDSAVKTAASVVFPAFAKYQETIDSLDVPLHPQMFLPAAQLKMSQAKTAEEIAAAKSHLFNLQGEAAESGRVAARRLAFGALDTFKKTLPPLIAAAKTVLDRELAKATEAEAEFFKAHGLPREETSVSRRLAGLAAEIKHLDHCLTDTSLAGSILPPARNTYGNVVAFFRAP